MTSLNPSGFTTEAMNQALAQLLQRNADVMESLLKQRGEARVEGLSMPQFHGRMGESVELYFDQVVQYLQAKNIDYQDPSQNTRILAMVASNLKHNAHAWYRIHKESITDVTGLIDGLTQEFVPPDLQERLRDQLYSLHQRKCPSLEDYISRFRNAIMQVKDMSELDKITYFVRGLVSPTKEEVQYRRCQTVSEAISVALEYDRSHSSYSGFRGRQMNRHQHDTRNQYRPQQSYAPSRRFVPRHESRRDNMPEPMEIDSGRVSTFRPAVNKKTCAYCKKLGHSIDECYKKKNRDAQQKSTRGLLALFDPTTKARATPSTTLK